MKTIRIYSDESRHKNERFMLFGGIWIDEEKVKEARNEIKELRRKSGYFDSAGKSIDFAGEFKWKKISKKYFHVYRELVDIFFGWVEKDTVRFCCMLVDTHNSIIRQHNNIGTDGYFKLLYQLYYQNSKIPAIYKIFPDSISNSTTQVNLPKLDHCLDIGLQRRFAPLLNPGESVGVRGFVNNITPIDSHSSEFIQIVDVIIGAIGYFQNRLFLRDEAKEEKNELMKYVINKLVYSGTIMISGKKFLIAKSTKFNIWVFKPNTKKDLH
jgi:hypothetical protein